MKENAFSFNNIIDAFGSSNGDQKSLALVRHELTKGTLLALGGIAVGSVFLSYYLNK